MFSIIEVTNNDVFNYFFTFPIYLMFTIIPVIAILEIVKKAFK